MRAPSLTQMLAPRALWEYGLALKEKALAGLTAPSYTVTGPSVSLVIPALQEQDYIEPLLISARNQTYQPLEIIIADSSPPDAKAETASIANKYGATMVDAPFGNVSLARNVGARAASSQILIFMDADCIMGQQFVEDLVKDLENGAKLSHGNDCFYDDDPKNVAKAALALVKPLAHTTGRGVAMWRDDFFAIGGYDELLNPADTGAREDLDLGKRVMATFGASSIYLDRDAVVAEASRRPWSFPGSKVWPDRGWRKGQAIQ